MGYERKRGKLADLNALLRGTGRATLLAHRRRHVGACPTSSTSSRSTPTRSCRATRRGSWSAPWRTRSTAALRRRQGRRRRPATASCSRASRQPAGANRSRYARLYGGEPGIDPLHRAVSDIYQDLFGEGSFIGKGIYDVDAFERALGALSGQPHSQPRPARRLLRPRRPGERRRAVRRVSATLLADVSRRYRWIRGDWQLRGWLLPGRADRYGADAAQSACRRCRDGSSSTTCGAASSPPALTVLLLLGWTVYVRDMWIGPGLAIAAFVYLLVSGSSALFIAVPILLLWGSSPVIAWWTSRAFAESVHHRLSSDQTSFLRRIARRTWAFFDTYVGAADHWLAPDNFQEQPAAGIAHRTSPTNIGLSLLAHLSAHDFGFLSTQKLLDRTGNTLATLGELDRYRGHFFNWYDTQTLAVLSPRYVSSVDSGNLAGHLLTLRAGLLEIPDQPILDRRVFDALSTTAGILLESLVEQPPEDLLQLKRALDAACESNPSTLSDFHRSLTQLAASAAAVAGGLDAQSEVEGHWWARALADDAADALADLMQVAPWTAQLAVSGSATPSSLIDRIPTLREVADLKERLIERYGLRVPVRHRSAICWRSATTSTSGGWTPATTTCWRRRRGWHFVALPRADCRRRAGSPWAAC
jgi:hypothetical protein